MDFSTFAASIAEHFPPGTVLHNPGGGTTTIIGGRPAILTYLRANSSFRVRISDLHRAYNAFKGKRVSTVDLRAYAPEVFSTKEHGHDCNCTTLFLLLEGMGLSSPIKGKGVRGDPFWVVIRE